MLPFSWSKKNVAPHRCKNGHGPWQKALKSKLKYCFRSISMQSAPKWRATHRGHILGYKIADLLFASMLVLLLLLVLSFVLCLAVNMDWPAVGHSIPFNRSLSSTSTYNYFNVCEFGFIHVEFSDTTIDRNMEIGESGKETKPQSIEIEHNSIIRERCARQVRKNNIL